jgi:hypothetical protein
MRRRIWRFELVLIFMGLVFFAVGYGVYHAGWLKPPRKIYPADILQPPEDWETAKDRALGRLLHAFLLRVDSLQRDSMVKKDYDSLLRARPGLVDSARAAERIYYSPD